MYYNNMKLTFKQLRLDENQEYDAVVRNVVVNEEKGKVRIFIEIEGIKEQTFMKSIPLELTEGSMLWNFCNNNELILSILVYTFFSRMFDLMLPPVAKHSIVVA